MQDQQSGSLSQLRSLDDLWPVMREEAQRKATEEPILGSYFHAILNHKSFADALSFRLASKLDNPILPTMLIRDVIAEAADAHTDILSAAEIDIIANFTGILPAVTCPAPFCFSGLSRPTGSPHRPLAVVSGSPHPRPIFPKPNRYDLGRGHSSCCPYRQRHYV